MVWARCVNELSSDYDTSRSSIPALISYTAIIKVMIAQLIICTFLFLAGLTEHHSDCAVLRVIQLGVSS